MRTIRMNAPVSAPGVVVFTLGPLFTSMRNRAAEHAAARLSKGALQLCFANIGHRERTSARALLRRGLVEAPALLRRRPC